MATDREDYFSVLTDAVNEMSSTGFVSSERVAYWQRRLREAAEKSMRSLAQMEADLKAALGATYKRLVDQGGLARYHGGVSRFTVDRLRPQLRAALDRRIMASADLIKLNRRQAVEKTLQRFSGWATSIPPGGASAFDKVETKQAIRKSLVSFSYEERRLATDQGHKLVASINAVVAEGGGAIAVRWHSHWRQPGYDYRPDHKERDGEIYLLKGNWAAIKGFVKPGDAGYYEAITAVAEEPYCRCWAEYIYALRDLPEDMLTIKGREEMERVSKIVEAL